MSNLVQRGDAPAWEAPAPHARVMGILFERDITPTRNVSAGFVLIPPGGEQPKLSSHPGVEEIYYVLRGTGTFVLGEDNLTVRPGSAVYVGPDVSHRAINDGDVEMELLWFNSPPAFGPVGSYTEVTRGWTDVRGSTHPADAT